MINLPKFKSSEPTSLEKEIERLLCIMATMDPESQEYAQIADQLVKLYELKELSSKSRLSSDALAGIIANILGILVITNYEHGHALTSKAVGFVGKKFNR